jgi:DNA polymerase-4
VKAVGRGGSGQPSTLHSNLAVCIWIPRFALRCEEHRRHEATERATALLAPDDLRRVWQIGSKARQSGVRPGMTVSQAVGLCPSLIVWEPDPIYYDEQFSQLVKALGNVSPSIEPAELGRVFVGVDGLAGLYGELAEQIEAIRATLGAEGKRETGSEDDERRANSTRPPVRPSAFPPGGDWSGAARLGWARGKFAAWVAATKARPGETFIVTDDERTEFLASQPVGVLRMSPDTHRRLTQLSIRTVKDLTRLPEVAVVSQFGNEGRRLWQLAAGTVVDPVVGRETPEPIVSEMEFPNPVADLAMLTNALDRLIERALRHPQRAGWRILEVGARARQEHGASWTTRCTLKDPSADRDHIAAPLKTRLAATPPNGAVESIAVEFLTFVRGTNELQLFARDASSNARAGRRRALRTAVHEMKTRFRQSSMYRVVEVYPGSRIPERRYALIDYDP